MNKLYQFPESTKVDKTITKKLIYKKTKPSQKIKTQFIKEIDKIIWNNKLSDDTINIPAKKSIKEFQIFTIIQKRETISESLLKFIDKSIPSPIIYQLHHNQTIKYATLINNDNKTNIYYSDPISTQSSLNPLPVALDLEDLYHELIKSIIDIPLNPSESITDITTRADKIRDLNTELQKLEKEILNKMQYNRKVEMNSRIKSIKKELEEIKVG